MEEKVCRCEQTSSEVGEDLSSEEDARTKLSYTSARGSKCVAPQIENPTPISVPAPCHPCGSSTALPALEEITKEHSFTCDDLDALLREADKGRVRDLQEESPTLWYIFHLEFVQKHGGDSMESIECVQGQAEGSRGQHDPGPTSEGLPQDVLQSFGVQESQEDIQPLHLAPAWEQSIPLFSGEMRDFLPAHLGNQDWFSRERSLSGHLVESLVSGYAIT